MLVLLIASGSAYVRDEFTADYLPNLRCVSPRDTVVALPPPPLSAWTHDLSVVAPEKTAFVGGGGRSPLLNM